MAGPGPEERTFYKVSTLTVSYTYSDWQKFNALIKQVN